MTTYYVSTAGNDSNNGTSSTTPWQTLSKVTSSTFAGGDSILFRGGDTFTGELWITATRAGTPSNRVTYASYGIGRATINNTTGAGCFIDTTGGVTVQNLIFTGGGSNTQDGIPIFKTTTGRASGITINNCDISGFNQGISVGNNTVASGGFDNVQITYCKLHDNKRNGFVSYGVYPSAPTYANTNLYIGYTDAYNNQGDPAELTNNTGSGIIVGSTDTATVEYCTAYSNGSLCAAPSGPEGIWTYDSNKVTIQRCISYNNTTGSGNVDGDGLGIDVSCTNCIIQYCLSYGNFGSGILVYNFSPTTQSNNVVRYNLCWGNVRSSVVMHGEITIGDDANGCQVYNNTCIAMDNTATTKPPALAVVNTTSGHNPTGHTVRNNILYQLGSGAVVRTNGAYTTTNVLFQGNDYYRITGLLISWNSVAYNTLSAWRTAIANQEQVSAVNSGTTVSPLLVDPTASPNITDIINLHNVSTLKLQANSPVANSGLGLQSLFGIDIGSYDYFGVGLASPYSIGAHNLAPVPPTPFIPGNSTFPSDTLFPTTGGVEGGGENLLYMQYELDGFLFGGNPNPPSQLTSYVIQSVEFADPQLDTQDAPIPLEDGIIFGRDFKRGRVITFNINILTQGSAVEALSNIAAAWDNNNVRQYAGATSVLRFNRHNRVSRVYGRARKFAPITGNVDRGWVPLLCDFKTVDHFFYSDIEETITVPIIPPPSGGWVMPFTFPVTPGGIALNTTNFVIGGTKPTWITTVINGPIINPIISTGLWQFQLQVALAKGEFIRISPAPWERYARRNGTTSVRSYFTQESARLSQMKLSPGTQSLVLSGIDPTGTSSVNVFWREARTSF